MNPIVLSIDDSDDDALLLQRACQKAGARFDLEIVEDGQRAVEYLSAAPTIPNQKPPPVPTLILMDLNMPGQTGLELLAWIRAQATLARIPIVVFTSSENDSDVNRAYTHGADCYCAKPSDFLTLVRIVSSLDAALHNQDEPLLDSLRAIQGFKCVPSETH